MQTATGTFEVTVEPIDSGDEAIGRMRLTKTFAGDLVGTASGQMLSTGTSRPDSAGYVAIDRVTGTVHGRSGTFVLQHNGLMARGDGTLTVTVVPDSGTGELTGLAGNLAIDVVEGEHRYKLEYTLETE
jgi:hypothetical protein